MARGSDLKAGNVLMASRSPTQTDARGFVCKARLWGWHLLQY